MCLEKFDFWSGNNKAIKLNCMKECSQVFPMLFNGLYKNEYIINVNNGMTGKWIENLIHNVLEFTGCILQTERHDIPFIMTKRRGEGCFIPTKFFDLYLPKTTLHVKLTEDDCLTKPVN